MKKNCAINVDNHLMNVDGQIVGGIQMESKRTDKLKTLRELEKDCHWHFDTLHELRQAARQWDEYNDKMIEQAKIELNEQNIIRCLALKSFITHFFNLDADGEEKDNEM